MRVTGRRALAALLCAGALSAPADEPFALGGSEGTLTQADGAVVFDSSRAVQRDVYHYGHARFLRGAEGDFAFTARVDVARLDHWNAFRLKAEGLEGGWRAELVRENRQAGEAFLSMRSFRDGKKTDEASVPFDERRFDWIVARRGDRISWSWRKPDGAPVVVDERSVPDADPVAFAFSFDSPRATVQRVTVSDAGLTAEWEPPDAWMPGYESRPLRIAAEPLAGTGGEVDADGVWILTPGTRRIFAAQAPATATDWGLEWKSAGRVKIRAVQLGSAETLQLSDNVVWDDVGDAVPDGFVARSRGIAPWIRRFNSDIRWPLSFPYSSGIFFFEVSPAGSAPIRFSDLRLVCRPMRNPRPLPAERGAVDYPVAGKVGAVDVVHAAGRQPKGSPDSLAGWLYVYVDGTTACAYATLRWTCGVFREDDIADTITPDMTWFGPPGFAWGAPLYESANEHGTHWNTWYRWRFVNPHPEKSVAKVQMFRLPGDRRDYRVKSVTPVAAADCVVALVEPGRADLASGEPVAVNVYEYRAAADGGADETRSVCAEKGPGVAAPVGAATLVRRGRFAAAATTVRIDAEKDVPAGGVTLVAGNARSSRLSLMPPVRGDEKPFHYTMICGGHDHFAEYDRMRRCGFDEAKIHEAWNPVAEGGWDLGDLDRRVAKIGRAGMDVALRNAVPAVKSFKEKLEPLYVYRGGSNTVLNGNWTHDTADPFYRGKLVDYYRCMGRFAAAHPRVKGINANYGQRLPVALPGPKPALVWNASRLKAFGAWRQARGLSPRKLTPDAILADEGLLAEYARWNEEAGGSLIQEICAAIRSGTDRPHLTFNVNFHPIENKLSGQTFADYLRAGLKYGPNCSLFHETSERYSLSFAKWMAAARTCGLVYGDECCQNPPSYEQAAMAYMWMGMMQCFESNYCQWWGGRPATENVAQFKAYHRLLMDADYLPDPVALALSFETGFAEIGDTLRAPLHTRTAHHYALAHFLRELNVNPDRYFLDAFPDLDRNVKSRLLVDDVTRSMSPEFAARIRRFVEAGGVYLASVDTDCLNGHAFLRSFGFTAAELERAPHAEATMPVAERPCGAGRVVLLRKPWSFGWDPGHPEPERRAALALLTRLGGFEPLVQTSHPCVFATPYRAKDGDGLVSLVNISCADREVELTLSRAFAGETPPRILDHGTGLVLPVALRDGRWTLQVRIGALNTTVLRRRLTRVELAPRGGM